MRCSRRAAGLCGALRTFRSFAGLKFGARKLIVVTAHRREKFLGAGLTDICRGIRRLASERRDIEIVYPVHPNPNVQAVAHPCRRPRAVDYRALGLSPVRVAPQPGVSCPQRLRGIQEEMPSLGRPALVMRENTGTPEGAKAGVCKLVGTSAEVIYRRPSPISSMTGAYARVAGAEIPSATGEAAQKSCRRSKTTLLVFNGVRRRIFPSDIRRCAPRARRGRH